MRKLFKTILPLCLALLLCVFSGCSKTDVEPGPTLDLSGTTWQHGNEFFTFEADGKVLIYDAQGTLRDDVTGTYTWDGRKGEFRYEDILYVLSTDGIRLAGTIDGSVTVHFDQVDHPGEISTEGAMNIADTAWNYEGISYIFFDDGTFVGDNGTESISGEYLWNGESGTMTYEELTIGLAAQNNALCMVGENGELYEMESLGSFAESSNN